MTDYSKERFQKLAGILKEYHAVDLDKDKLNVTDDNEGGMVQGQLERIIHQAQILLNNIPHDAQMESWVQSKITSATDLIDSVKHYLVDEINDEIYSSNMDESAFHFAKNDEISKVAQRHVSMIVRDLNVNQDDAEIIFDDLYTMVRDYLKSNL